MTLSALSKAVCHWHMSKKNRRTVLLSPCGLAREVLVLLYHVPILNAYLPASVLSLYLAVLRGLMRRFSDLRQTYGLPWTAPL